jgi:hypothetical protein
VRIFNRFKWSDANVTFSQDDNMNFKDKFDDQRTLLNYSLPFKEGYLSKLNPGTEVWVRKYFILQGKYLFFFPSKNHFEDKNVKILIIYKFIYYISLFPLNHKIN